MQLGKTQPVTCSLPTPDPPPPARFHPTAILGPAGLGGGWPQPLAAPSGDSEPPAASPCDGTSPTVHSLSQFKSSPSTGCGPS